MIVCYPDCVFTIAKGRLDAWMTESVDWDQFIGLGDRFLIDTEPALSRLDVQLRANNFEQLANHIQVLKDRAVTWLNNVGELEQNSDGVNSRGVPEDLDGIFDYDSARNPVDDLIAYVGHTKGLLVETIDPNQVQTMEGQFYPRNAFTEEDRNPQEWADICGFHVSTFSNRMKLAKAGDTWRICRTKNQRYIVHLDDLKDLKNNNAYISKVKRDEMAEKAALERLSADR